MDPGIIQQLAQMSTGSEDVVLVESRLELLTQKKIICKFENFIFGLAETFKIKVEGNDKHRSSSWVFRLQPSGTDYSSIDCVFSYFQDVVSGYRFNDLEKEIFHRVEATILESNGTKKWRTYNTSLLSFTNSNSKQIFCINDTTPDLPLISGGLVVEVNLKLLRRAPILTTTLKKDDAQVGTSVSLVNKPRTNVRAFLNSKHHSDVKIISSDGKEFHTHKVILGGGSDVFDAMFKAEMTESTTGIVKLDDVYAGAVTFLLTFIYCGDILPFTVNGKKNEGVLSQTSASNDNGAKTISTEDAALVTAEKALYVASKYKLDELLDFFDHSFRRLCCEENAISLLELSKLHSLNCKEFLKNFIKSRPSIMDEILEH